MRNKARISKQILRTRSADRMRILMTELREIEDKLKKSSEKRNTSIENKIVKEILTNPRRFRSSSRQEWRVTQ